MMRILWMAFLVVLPRMVFGSVELSELKSMIVGQLESRYGGMKESPLSSGILYDLATPLSGLEHFDGTLAAPAATFSTWEQIAFELKRASLTPNTIPAYDELRRDRQIAQRAGDYPLMLMIYEYQRVADKWLMDSLLQYDNGQITGMRTELLTTERTVAMTVLNEWTYHGEDVVFKFDRERHMFGNAGEIASLDVDFSDGSGYRKIAEEKTLISYATTGEKLITARVTLASGEVLFARTRLDVRSLDAPAPSETWQLTASHSFSGTPASGEAYILYAPGHSMLTRPIVLVEGLDLNNSLNWDELYDLMNQELLIETLLEIGFDAVVLNYGNSTMHVQDNAFLVQELIEEINSATGGIHPLVMIGTSLGGITTRYALTYMEANNLEHNVSTFISVDSPQNGANIPVGIQHWADFFASEAAEAAAARDALLTPAPRQLLLYHFSSSGSGTANPDPLFAALQSDLASLGDYPSQPRLVSVINGSSTQQNSGYAPGAQIIRWVYDSFLVDIRGNVWAVSNTVNTRVLQGEINVIWPLPDRFSNVFIAPCLPWDNAPGGLTATMEELAAVPAPYGDIQALYPSHCFIPSISALDLNVADPFFNIAGAPNLYDLTPFDSVYYPVNNQDHVQITPQNAQWFIQEVIGPLAAPELTMQVEGDSLHLRWTPIFGATAYDVYASTEYGTWPNPPMTTTGTELVIFASEEAECFRVVAKRN